MRYLLSMIYIINLLHTLFISLIIILSYFCHFTGKIWQNMSTAADADNNLPAESGLNLKNLRRLNGGEEVRIMYKSVRIRSDFLWIFLKFSHWQFSADLESILWIRKCIWYNCHIWDPPPAQVFLVVMSFAFPGPYTYTCTILFIPIVAIQTSHMTSLYRCPFSNAFESFDLEVSALITQISSC